MVRLGRVLHRTLGKVIEGDDVLQHPHRLVKWAVAIVRSVGVLLEKVIFDELGNFKCDFVRLSQRALQWERGQKEHKGALSNGHHIQNHQCVAPESKSNVKCRPSFSPCVTYSPPPPPSLPPPLSLTHTHNTFPFLLISFFGWDCVNFCDVV